MDERLRQLEREAQTGDVLAIVRWAQVRLRQGDLQAVREALHPIVKKSEEARKVFDLALPVDAHAFCLHCGAILPLHPTGYPRTPTGRESKRRRFCDACTSLQSGSYAHAHATHLGPGPLQLRPLVLAERYCPRCGAVKRDATHRCSKRLPDWITGEGAQPAADHWSLQRPEDYVPPTPVDRARPAPIDRTD